MTESTPLLKQNSDVSRGNTARGYEEAQEVIAVHEAEYEIPSLRIAMALFLEWQRNGANEEFTSQDVMAMHLQYRQVTGGREILHAQKVIMDELADVMFLWAQQGQFYIADPCSIQLKNSILRNLRENWPSITNFDENVARNLNVYQPPPFHVRIRNVWTNFVRTYTALKRLFFKFTCQFLLIFVMLSWPLSLLTMGAKYMSQCPMNRFLPDATVAVGLVGIVALLSRLVLSSIENWCWFPTRAAHSCFWIVLKFLEFAFLLVLFIILWFFLDDSPSFNSKDPNFCNETFYSFLFWMKYISAACSLVWMAVSFTNAVSWLKRLRYQYRPLFDDSSNMNLLE